MKGVKLSEAEKDFIEDMPEVKTILEKVLKKVIKNVSPKEDASDEILELLDEQAGEIATLRTQVALNRMVPEWESLVFDGNKRLESGERKPNPEFWKWLDDQPDLYRALANSDNPTDNAAVLNFYKSERAKQKLSEKDEADKKKLDKVKDLHSHSANADKTTKREKKKIDDDDFGGYFAEAGKKAAKGQI